MYVVYSAPDAPTVRIIKGILEQRGIRTLVRGERRQGVADVDSAADAWVELFVLKMQDVPVARNVVEEVVSAQPTPDGEPWVCTACGESIEGQFATCWNCGADREERTQP